MMLDPSCPAVHALGHSWGPSPNWWLSLTASDQGAWISGVGALAAAIVALAIALSESWRRRSERLARRRLVKASFYSPTTGIVAMLMDIEKDCVFLSGAQNGIALDKVEGRLERLKLSCDTLRPLLPTLNLTDALYLEKDAGVGVIACLRDIELIIYGVTSVTDMFPVHKANAASHRLSDLLHSLRDIPRMANKAIGILKPLAFQWAKDLGLE